MIFFAEQRTELPDSLFSRQQISHWKFYPKKQNGKKKRARLSRREMEKKLERKELMEGRGFRKQLEVAAKLLHLVEVEKRSGMTYSSVRKWWRELLEKASDSEAFDVRDSIDERRERLLKSSTKRDELFREYKWLKSLGIVRRGRWKDPSKNPDTWWGKQNLLKEEEAMKKLAEAKGTSIDKLLDEGKKTVSSAAVSPVAKKSARAVPSPKKEKKGGDQPWLTGAIKRISSENGSGILSRVEDLPHSKVLMALLGRGSAEKVRKSLPSTVEKGKIGFGRYVFELGKDLIFLKVERVSGPRTL